MFYDFSENSPWKLNILVSKGSSTGEFKQTPQTPSKSATYTCLVYWLSDSTWAKPEVNMLHMVFLLWKLWWAFKFLVGIIYFSLLFKAI